MPGPDADLTSRKYVVRQEQRGLGFAQDLDNT